MRIGFLMLTVMLFSSFAYSQDVSSLPVIAYPTKNVDSQKPFIVYLSGDGGENSFSKSFVQQFVNNGYSAIFFNSFKYFWSKKTPSQAAVDVEKVINYYKGQWRAKKVILIGYSFGADVAPFLLTRFSKETFSSLRNVVLMSPSKTTDFEVHVTELFGKGKNAGSSVAAEINKIPAKPLLILSGEDESDKIEPTDLKVPYKLLKLKGGHKYDSNTLDVATAIFKNL